MDFFESFLEGYPEVRSPDLPHALPSAFAAYKRPAMAGPNPNSQNLNKRVIEMLRRIQTAATNDRELERDPGYRHMISERHRRDNLKEKFKILHSLLPRRTKNEKLSILTVAAQQLRELKRRKEELQRRNDEVSGSRVEREEENGETATVGIEVQYPTSPIDCVMGVAGCLRSRGLKAMRMRVEVSHPEMSVMVDVQAEDVKKAEEAIGNLLGSC